MIPQRHGQTDGRTTCRSDTALCVASRGDNRAVGYRNRTNETITTVIGRSLNFLET